MLAEEIKKQWTRSAAGLTTDGKEATSGLRTICQNYKKEPDTKCTLKFDGTAGIHEVILHWDKFERRLFKRYKCNLHKCTRIVCDDGLLKSHLQIN